MADDCFKEKNEKMEKNKSMTQEEAREGEDAVEEEVHAALVSSINNIKRNMDEQLQQRQASRSASPLQYGASTSQRRTPSTDEKKQAEASLGLDENRRITRRHQQMLNQKQNLESNNSMNTRLEEPQRQTNDKYYTPAKKAGALNEKPLTSTKDHAASGVEEDEGL